jgi:hypothetical protein
MSWIVLSRFKLKLRLSKLIVIVLAIGVVTGLILRLSVSGPDWDRTHRYPAVSLPLGDLSEIAGAYFRGGRYGGDNLSILPDGRYSFFRSSCTGVYDRESGYVRIDYGSYVLEPQGPTRPKAERTLISIRWKSRCYLIPPERMQEFCDAILDGEEPRDGGIGQFYLDATVRVDGVPELPAKWAVYLRENLVIGKIVEVMEGGRVKLDLGSTDGIQQGSILVVQGRDQVFPRRLEVVSHHEKSSLAVEPEPTRRESDPPLQVGRNVVMARILGRESTSPLAQLRRSLNASGR